MAPSPPGVTVGEQVPVVVEPYPDGDSMDAAMGLLGLTIGVPGRDMSDRYEGERCVENQALWPRLFQGKWIEDLGKRYPLTADA